MKKIYESMTKTALRSVVSVMIILLSYMLVFTLLFVEVPERNVRLVDICIGILLGGCVAGVVGYLFGSSKGNSKEQISNEA